MHPILTPPLKTTCRHAPLLGLFCTYVLYIYCWLAGSMALAYAYSCRYYMQISSWRLVVPYGATSPSLAPVCVYANMVGWFSMVLWIFMPLHANKLTPGGKVGGCQMAPKEVDIYHYTIFSIVVYPFKVFFYKLNLYWSGNLSFRPSESIL